MNFYKRVFKGCLLVALDFTLEYLGTCRYEDIQRSIAITGMNHQQLAEE